MNNNFNNFNNMDDLFNQLMGGMRGYCSENQCYWINGREVGPGRIRHLPSNRSTSAKEVNKFVCSCKGMKQDGILQNLT